MPQTDSAKKALRSSDRRRVTNDRWRRKMREALHEVRDAITAGKKKDAQKALIKATSVMDRVARRNITTSNKASRKQSRLQKAINKISA